MPSIYWGFEVLIWIVVPTLVLVLAVRKGGLRLPEIGLHAFVRGKRRPLLLVVLCVAFGPLELHVYKQAVAFFRGIIPSDSLFGYQSIVPREGALRTLAIIYLSLTAGIVEEIYFRGFFFRSAAFLHGRAPLYLLFSPLLSSLP